MSEWVRIAAVAEIPPGEGRELTAAGRVIALYHVEGAFYALDGICPHAGGPLGEGQLNGRIVTCPWHGWQFDVASGQHCLTAQLKHTQFAVEVRGEDLYVELP